MRIQGITTRDEGEDGPSVTTSSSTRTNATATTTRNPGEGEESDDPLLAFEGEMYGQTWRDSPRPPQRYLSARHLNMIAIGGTVGTGLFIGSGVTIATAGPAGALLAFALVGIMVFFITTSLGEMTTLLPVSGSFSAHASRFVDPALGFALGWNYWVQWAVTLPSELSATGIIMSFWMPHLPSWIWSALILGFILAIHMMGVRGFGESEFILSFIKVAAILLFILAGLLIVFGLIGDSTVTTAAVGSTLGDTTHPSIPQHHFIGLENWTIPGAPFKNGFLGIFKIFLVAFFSFGGTELVGITAVEVHNPRVNVPKAISQTFWRILLFYILSIFVIGLVLRNDDPTLLDAYVKQDITLAPFTRVFQLAGISWAAHAMNGIILISVVSAANSAVYAASRTLMFLAQEGYAPELFCATSSAGVPVNALWMTSFIGCTAFLGIIFGDGVVFTWLLSITGISGILSWLSIACIHLRFRQAYAAQGQDPAKLPYRSPFFPVGPWVSLILGAVIVVGEGWSALAISPASRQATLWTVMTSYVGIPIFAAFFFGYKWAYQTRLVPLLECDFLTGASEDLDAETENTN